MSDRSTAEARPVRTVFLGSGSFAVPILRRLSAHPSVEVVAVVSAPPRPVGRRQVETPTPVHATASELGLEVMTTARLRDPAAIADILGRAPGLIVLADYGQIVPAELLDLPHGALNLHPSVLPRHRGASPVVSAILAGDSETGVTLMRMDAGLDTGPIVATERVALGDETAPALEARLAITAADLLERSLDPWLAGELKPRPQPGEGATLTRPLRRSDGRLDPAAPAIDLERTVRAYLPWPGTFVETDDGMRLVILRAAVAPAQPGDRPGVFVSEDGSLALTTGDGRLLLHQVQLAGGRPMNGTELLRGRPAILGRAVRA
ncbi:MAG: methionyl-tRNA formyltransferase [Chloroflexi bacterium]|nr:methionyl-tRNA formyltransferase [Chloroflexota bacterium]